MEPKNKGQTNFYEHCDLTKKCGMGYHTTKMGSLATVYYRETNDLKWSGSDHDLDHYLARKDRIVAHIFENGKG